MKTLVPASIVIGIFSLLIGIQIGAKIQKNKDFTPIVWGTPSSFPIVLPTAHIVKRGAWYCGEEGDFMPSCSRTITLHGKHYSIWLEHDRELSTIRVDALNSHEARLIIDKAIP